MPKFTYIAKAIIEDNLYKFFLHNASLILAFSIVGLSVHAFSLLPHDIASYEKLRLSETEYHIASKKTADGLSAENQKSYDLVLLGAKIDAANYGRNKVDEANTFLISLTKLLILVACIFFITGICLYLFKVRLGLTTELAPPRQSNISNKPLNRDS